MKNIILALVMMMSVSVFAETEVEEVELRKCTVRLQYTGNSYYRCNFGETVIGVRVYNVRPPFSTTMVECAKMIVSCPVVAEEVKE